MQDFRINQSFLDQDFYIHREIKFSFPEILLWFGIYDFWSLDSVVHLAIMNSFIGNVVVFRILSNLQEGNWLLGVPLLIPRCSTHFRWVLVCSCPCSCLCLSPVQWTRNISRPTCFFRRSWKIFHIERGQLISFSSVRSCGDPGFSSQALVDSKPKVTEFCHLLLFFYYRKKVGFFVSLVIDVHKLLFRSRVVVFVTNFISTFV